MKNQPTRIEVVKTGHYLGCTIYDNGATAQRWELNGIVFEELCNTNGMRSSWRCVGKKSRVEKYNL